MTDSIWKKKNKKLLNSANKMILKTTNREDFADFKVVPNTSRPSRIVEKTEDGTPWVVPVNNRVYVNDSKEFKSTMSFTTPIAFRSSYKNSFQNYGKCKKKFINKFRYQPLWKTSKLSILQITF